MININQLYTQSGSSLFWIIYKIYNVNEDKDLIKVKIAIFEKTSKNLYYGICPAGRPVTLKLIKSVTDTWMPYQIKESKQ